MSRSIAESRQVGWSDFFVEPEEPPPEYILVNVPVNNTAIEIDDSSASELSSVSEP